MNGDDSYSLVARLEGPGGKVYAFEPDRGALKNLRATLRANDFPNVTVIPKTASDRSAICEFTLSRTASHIGLYAAMGLESVVGTVRVQTVAIDEFLQGERSRHPSCELSRSTPPLLGEHSRNRPKWQRLTTLEPHMLNKHVNLHGLGGKRLGAKS